MGTSMTMWMICRETKIGKKKNEDYLLLTHEPESIDGEFQFQGPAIYLADFIAKDILGGRTLKPHQVAEVKVAAGEPIEV